MHFVEVDGRHYNIDLIASFSYGWTTYPKYEILQGFRKDLFFFKKLEGVVDECFVDIVLKSVKYAHTSKDTEVWADVRTGSFSASSESYTVKERVEIKLQGDVARHTIEDLVATGAISKLEVKHRELDPGRNLRDALLLLALQGIKAGSTCTVIVLHD